MKTWLQASALLLLSVAVHLAAADELPSEGSTGGLLKITNGDELYQGAQRGNQVRLEITSDLKLTQKAGIFLSSEIDRVFGSKGTSPLLDCTGFDRAFVINKATHIVITDMTIGGCQVAAVTVKAGAQVTLERVVFRNHKSQEPGAALLVTEGTTVIGSGLVFSSIVTRSPIASVIHVQDASVVELTDSKFTGIATEGNLVSSSTGIFRGNKITIDSSNRLGGDAINLVGCAGELSSLTNSKVTYTPYGPGANTFINAFASKPGQATNLLATTNPKTFAPFDPKSIPNTCTLDISGSTFDSNQFRTALIATDGYGLIAKNINMVNSSQIGTPPNADTLPSVLSVKNGWVHMDTASFSDNSVPGQLLSVGTPSGPVILNGVTMKNNMASDLIKVQGSTVFLDRAVWNRARQLLPDLYFDKRPTPVDEEEYNNTAQRIAEFENNKASSIWRLPLVVSKGEFEGNTVEGGLIVADGTDADTPQEKGLLVRVVDTSVTGNTMSVGPAIKAAASNVTVQTTTFTRNKSPQGLLAVSDGVMRLFGSTFEDNTVAGDETSMVVAEKVRSSVVDKSDFSGNIAPAHILLIEDSTAAITDTSFKSNTAGSYIAAAKVSEVLVRGFQAEGNTAQAVLFLDRTPLSITGSSFKNNNAAGLLADQNAALFNKQPSLMRGLTFEGNVIDKRAMGVATVSNIQTSVNLQNSKFIGNMIQSGVNNATGGLFANSSDVAPWLYIDKTLFKDNVGAFGGGMWTSVSTSVNQSEFTGNKAFYSGGAIYGEGSKLAVAKSTIIKDNMAGSGGGITCKECQVVSLRNIDLTSNTANESLVPDSLTSDAPTVPCVIGGGGGICIETSDKGGITNVSQVNFKDNGGKFGGAVFLGNGCDNSLKECKINLDRLSAENNTAGKGGGDNLFATSYANIVVCCVVAKTNKINCNSADQLGVDSLDVTCAADGTVLAKDGSRVATIPARLMVTSPWAGKAVASGSTMLDAEVTLVDNAGKPVQSVAKELMVEIDSTRLDMTIIGNRSVFFNSKPQLKIVGFQVLPSVSPSNQQYEIRFKVTGTKYASRIAPGAFNVTIPQCTIGQYEFMFRCVECGTYNGQYSLTPSVRCEPCPSGGNCTKGYLVPRSGYFQPNPLVPQLQECPLEGSCRRSEATMGKLISFVDQISEKSGEVGGFTRLRSDMIGIEEQFNKLQCSKGYFGRFCGVCSEGYGRWNTRCVKCASRSLNNWYLFLAIMFIIFLISITIASHLRAALYKRAPPTVAVPRAESGESAGQPVENRRKVYDLEQILAEQARRKLDARLDVDQITRQQEEEEQQKAVEAAQIEAERSSLHFSMLTALAKIMISYVQVVGMARGLDLNIPRPLRRFLSNYDYTSSLSWLSIECSLKGSAAAKAIKRTIITISLPLIIMAFFTLYWLMKYWRRRAKARSSQQGPGVLQAASQQLTRSKRTSPSSFFANRMITTALQVAFYTYPLVTSTLFRIFDCTNLRSCNSPTECQYSTLNQGGWKLGWYWTQSYDTECFKGSHLQLIVGGTVGIAVFSIGVPLVFAFSIWLRRSKLEDPRTLLRFGFLYWEYRTSAHWWEAVITARKLALLMTTIFLRYTGRYAPSIQIYTSLMVLMVAVLLQEMFRPFEDELLNRMERLSLFTSATTLVLMAYYLVGPISTGVRTALAGIIMMINLAALLQFIVLILWELWLWLLEKLQIEPPESFKFSDMMEVSRKVRGRWKDVRAVVVDEWLMPSLVKTLNTRHSTNGRRRLPTSIPTQEDAT